MAQPFLGEIKIMSFGTAPAGWAQCNGQLLLVSQNQALYSLIGNTFGGVGPTTFALPNLQGRVPIHDGNSHVLGEAGGEAAHTLTINETPPHTHDLKAASDQGTQLIPGGNLLAKSLNQLYRGGSPALNALDASSISVAGGSQPHENRQPYLTLNFCIALQGVSS
jgi:microcystin-dependent protein